MQTAIFVGTVVPSQFSKGFQWFSRVLHGDCRFQRLQQREFAALRELCWFLH